MTRDRLLTLGAVLSFPAAVAAAFTMFIGLLSFSSDARLTDSIVMTLSGAIVLVAAISAFVIVARGGGMWKRFLVFLGALVLAYSTVSTAQSSITGLRLVVHLILSGIPASVFFLLACGFFETPPNQSLQQTGEE